MLHPHKLFICVVVGALVLAGCNSPDQRLEQFARHSLDEQADQNRRMSDAARTVAEGSKELVQSEGKARQELIALQQDLRQDQASVARQRDVLEADRKAIHSERQRESIWGGLVLGCGILLACLAPLLLAALALRQLSQPTSPEEVTEVLAAELTKLLSQPPKPNPPEAAKPLLGPCTDSAHA